MNRLKKILQEQHIWISAITEIELLSHPKLKSEEVKLINSFLNECLVLDLTKPVKQIAIKLRRKKILKLPDAIIAATSIHLDFPLVTMDHDFNKIKQLNAVILEV